jgi:hypothetical protein
MEFSVCAAAVSSNKSESWRKAINSAGVAGSRCRPFKGLAIVTITTVVGSVTGGLRSRKPFATVKIAEFTPIPNPSVRVTVEVNPGFFHSNRPLLGELRPLPWVVRHRQECEPDGFATISGPNRVGISTRMKTLKRCNTDVHNTVKRSRRVPGTALAYCSRAFPGLRFFLGGR